MAGLYIHIPFCASRCIYCGFYSTTLTDLQDKYVEAVCREIEIKSINQEIQTIYLGGGTPSQLSKENLQKIFNTIHKVYPNTFVANSSSDCEITLECNPDDVTLEFAQFVASLGVNRVSMGAQTFNDERLKFLHRRHTSEEVILAVQRLRSAGIHNISIDLMFGFPNQTLFEWEEDLWMALSLNPEHISAYSLMYEEGTALYRMLETNKVKEIDDELSLAMYNKLIDLLSSADYEHYEISNFARLDPSFNAKVSPYRSRHNSSYWHEVPYIGIGAAAHSYNKVSRLWNISDVRKYIDLMLSTELTYIPKEVYEEETLDINTRYDDLITTALRTREGIDLAKMRKEYGEDLYKFLIEASKKHIAQGYLKSEDDHLAFTREGIYISDAIMSDLMHV